MKKRIASLLLTLVMVLSLVPALSVNAFAATSTVSSKNDSRIEYMLKNIEYQNFSGSSLTAAKVQNYMRHFMFDSGFAAIGGGTFNYPNSGAYTWEVSDGTYNKVAIRGSTGCCAYCYYVSKVVYGVDWVDSSRQTKLYSASQLKNFLLQYAQAGEHLRADPSHSVTFISGDDAGFYCFSYCGDGNPVIHLDYWTYDEFYAKYGGYSIYVYDVFKSDNTSTMGCKDGHHYNCNVVTAPTKTSAGTLRCYCPVCRSTKDVTLPKLSTADYTLETIGSTTCTSGAVERYTWKNKEYGTFKFDVQGAAGSHNYTYSVAAEPTETEQGSIKGYCSKCGNAVYYTIPALNGVDYGNMIVGEATCTKGCSLRYTWKNTQYGSYYFDVGIPPMGHAYFDDTLNKVTKDPTDDSEGVLTCTCFRCNEKTQIILPKFDPSEYSHEITAATCTADGKDAWIWLVEEYGDVRFEKTLPALGHDYVDGVCTRCGDISAELTVPFVDLKAGEYYIAPVLWASSFKPTPITTGTDATHFSPNAGCTRGQVVTFLWRAAGCPEPTTAHNPFVDVENSGKCQPFYKAILWAAEKGITTGMDTTHFAPYANVTRGQVVTFLWRYAGTPAPTTANNPFVDLKAGEYYINPILWAAEKGITNGIDSTHFAPNATVTRAQVVTFLYRYAA